MAMDLMPININIYIFFLYFFGEGEFWKENFG